MEEALVYKLSRTLGGRDSVVNTPFVELLAHTITKIEEEQNDLLREEQKFYMEFMAMLHSNPQSDKEAKDTQKFIDLIRPTKDNKKGNKLPDKPQWSERVQRKIAEKQRLDEMQ